MSEFERFLGRHISRFVDNPDEAKSAEMLLDQGASKAQVFNEIAFGKGNGKQHVSGKPEGQLKDS